MPPAGLPRDPAQWLALVLALAVLLAARPLLRASARPRIFAALAALTAAALSTAYVAVYLRGGPRIIDATSYWLEARALAHGLFSFPLHDPETSVLGRFLVRSEHADGPHAAVIFPPGYPAVLALGFLARAPLAVGPVLAAGLAIVTYDLAGHVAKSLGLPAGAPSLPKLAALFSVACAALRYHTADTMSHGLAALCFASALSFAFHASDALADGRARRAVALAAAAGLAAGWLFATRPTSTLALAVALALALLPRRRLAPWIALGALPGVILFLAHQHAATGAWGASSQRLYYAVSDGPPGCFRYGFGAGVGCLGEHGDFVRARLADGFGFLAAAGTTLRRLKMHLVDPANAEPLALLVPLGAWIARKSPRARVLAVAVAAQIAVYVPFYFDGNYPGGGGRFYADVLPLEHVLAAAAVVVLAARRPSPERWASLALALSLAGFAFRAGFDHAALRDRDGGRPMFEPAELARAGVTRGLVLLDTDHGFDLAFDPGSRGEGVDAVRFHGDALDRMAWEARGRPPAFRYRFVVPPGGGPAAVSVEPFSFPPLAGPRVVEGESLWPPLAQEGGFALPEWAVGACASGARRLVIHPASGAAPATVTLALPAAELAGRSVAPRVVGGPGEIELSADGALLRRWAVSAEPGACRDLEPATVPPSARRVTLTLRRPSAPAAAAPLALDALNVGEFTTLGALETPARNAGMQWTPLRGSSYADSRRPLQRSRFTFVRCACIRVFCSTVPWGVIPSAEGSFDTSKVQPGSNVRRAPDPRTGHPCVAAVTRTMRPR
jgi:hypothetical protein